ncbi:ABC transporter ATP-binding protein [Ruegeria sp. EL01]|uniref:ABC transporter ATP-binding protein n=1 Tax=Ruegeria sp. EL01 TaxID=2107578 RepID=UPI000EA7FBAE|nr:ABC transporter ATP-binding protein [Ruegeria sp. EL01]
MGTLSIRNLNKSFGALHILKDISVEAMQGEFLVLVGPSGCGKSTLLSAIAGLQKSDSGEIRIDDRDVTNVAPKDRDIAMVFQTYALYPNLTVLENITFPLEARGVPRAERWKEADRVAGILHIENLLDRRPKQLSGGQRQRVAMGRALVRNPEIFLFDEPLSNLDAKLRVVMRTEIKKLHADLGTTMVYVTHDQIEAMTLATKIVVMKDGVVQQFGKPIDVYERPANQFVAGFMGSPAMNFLNGTMTADGVQVERPDGGTILVPAPNLAEGEQVVLGLRPEAISDAPFNDNGPAIPFQWPLELLEPTGAETIGILASQPGGDEIVARLSAKPRVATGRAVQLYMNLSNICLFDAQSGKALWHSAIEEGQP